MARRLAIDTTLVSPIRADGTARRHALLWRKHEERRSASTQSWPATGDVHASWWSQPKWGGGSLLRQTSFFEVKGKAVAAWSRRWRSMLGCVVANSIALSLLGRVSPGEDGEVPLLSDVSCAHRHR